VIHFPTPKTGIHLSAQKTYVGSSWPGDADGNPGDCSNPLLHTLGGRRELVLNLETGSRVYLPGIREEMEEADIDVGDPYLPSGFETLPAMQVLHRIAMDTMIPQMEEKVQLPLFLYELAEVRALALSALELLARLPSALKRLFKKPLKEWSNRHLEATFGWLPFVSDVKAIYTNYVGIADDLLKFLEGSNKRMTLHFQKALAPTTFQPDEFFDFYSSLTVSENSDGLEFLEGALSEITFDTHTTREIKDLVFHATLEFEYRLPDVTPFMASLYAELDSWGINLSPSLIWEAIPFSFVVDWVVNVGGWLKRFDKTNLPVQIVIYNYSYSIKYRLSEKTVTVGVSDLRWTPGGNDDSEGWTTPVDLVSAGSVTSYHRFVGVPQITPESLFRLPNGWQLVTGTALAVQSDKSLIRLMKRIVGKL
jgi:hypothetical protein